MADTKITALPAASLPPGAADVIPIVQGGISRQITRADLVNDTFRTLTATQASTSTTAAAVTGLGVTLGQGQYLVKYWVCYRAAATTTGIQMYLTHTGTTTRCAATWYTLSGGAATPVGTVNGLADQATGTTAQPLEGKGQRASGTASGTTQGVDTANADQFAVLEGIVIVTVSGTLNLMFNTEVASSAVTMMEGTSVTITRTA